MTFTLVDDGTLDTVVQCSECGGQERFADDSMLLTELDIHQEATMCRLRVENALDLAKDDHVCAHPDYPPCGLCNGPLELLGTLGKSPHGVRVEYATVTRCRNCGRQESWPHALEA